MYAGLCDKIEALQFSGTIKKVALAKRLSAQEPSAQNIDKGEVTQYVMDNFGYSRSLVDPRYGFFVYVGRMDSHSPRTCDHCSCGKPY